MTRNAETFARGFLFRNCKNTTNYPHFPDFVPQPPNTTSVDTYEQLLGLSSAFGTAISGTCGDFFDTACSHLTKPVVNNTSKTVAEPKVISGCGV